MDRQLAQYIMMLEQGDGRPVAPMQQPQRNAITPEMISAFLSNFGKQIVGDPERGLIKMRRPQNLPDESINRPSFY
jgi:hypothetical protein